MHVMPRPCSFFLSIFEGFALICSGTSTSTSLCGYQYLFRNVPPTADPQALNCAAPAVDTDKSRSTSAIPATSRHPLEPPSGARHDGQDRVLGLID
jgi:hypothetical protein